MKKHILFIFHFSWIFGNEPIAFSIPTIELDHRTDLQTVVDKEEGVYLGHPTTVLLGDGKSPYILSVRFHVNDLKPK